MSPQKTSFYLICLMMWWPIFAKAAPSEAPSDSFIKPYSATYSTTWKKGISLKVEGTQTLSQTPDKQWLFSFEADTFFASLNESVKFNVNQGQISPLVYEYHTSAFGKKRDAVLTFDWQKNRVRNDVKNKPWNMDIQVGVLDKLSIQLQIRQDLKHNKAKLDYLIADGGKLKPWHFERLGSEKINTQLGDINTIKVKREGTGKRAKTTTFWFAPKYDFLLVKLVHQEKKESYKLELESIK